MPHTPPGPEWRSNTPVPKLVWIGMILFVALVTMDMSTRVFEFVLSASRNSIRGQWAGTFQVVVTDAPHQGYTRRAAVQMAIHPDGITQRGRYRGDREITVQGEPAPRPYHWTQIWLTGQGKADVNGLETTMHPDPFAYTGLTVHFANGKLNFEDRTQIIIQDATSYSDTYWARFTGELHKGSIAEYHQLQQSLQNINTQKRNEGNGR